MSKDYITLSKKHGVNPSMPTCYYCGEATGEIILPGARGEAMARKLGNEDGKMPMYCPPISIIPCDKCKEKGVGFVEVDNETNREPTGRRWLIKDSALGFIQPDELREAILKSRICQLSASTVSALGLDRFTTKES